MKPDYCLDIIWRFGLRPINSVNNRTRAMCFWSFACALCAGVLLLFVPNAAGRAGAVKSGTLQTQLAPIGILLFQDETGLNAPPELGQKIAGDLRQKLIVSYKDVLPRMLNARADSSTQVAMNVEQVAALGKQNGVKFVVRGGLLAVTTESAGDGTKISVQLYASIISVETGSNSDVRAEGIGTQTGPVTDLSAVDLKSTTFRDSALGQALAAAVAQLANSIHDAIIAPAQTAATPEQPVPTPDSSAGATDTAAAQAATDDQETQQLIAQAEAILASNPNSSADNMNALRQALEGLKSSLATKADLLQQSKDTSAADQEIATHKQEMQIALANLTTEASAANSNTTAQTQQPTGEKKDSLARIDEFAGEALSLLQKIQELRSTLRSVNEDQSANNAPPQDATAPQDTGTQTAPPVEQTSGTVSGVVTDDGNPVAGTTVTNPETGQSTTTDANGTFTLKGLIAGHLSQLILTKNGQQIGKGQVDVPNGRTAIADFQINSLLAVKMSDGALPGVLASTVVSSPAKHPGVSAGNLKGEVRDSTGRPVPFALVQVPGVGMARTNAQGQYTFVNVPVGTYQLMVQQSGMKKSSQVAVAAKTTTDARTQFAPTDKTTTTNRSLLMAGTGTVLRGTVLDEQAHPISAAKISVIQSEATVSVLTAPSGTYELRNLKPGAYQVSVYKVGYQVASQAVTLKAAGTEQRNFQLSPVASASVNKLIRSALATQGTVSGTLRTQTGAPVANAAIEVRAKGQALLFTKTLTNSNGEYALKLVEGSYDLKAKHQSFQDAARTVSVRAGDATRADFELRQARSGFVGTGGGSMIRQPEARTGQLAGRVSDSNGKPIAGASIALQGQRRVNTDQEGNYTLVELMPDSYRIAVSKIGFAGEEKTISIRAGVPTRLDFVLKIAGSAIRETGKQLATGTARAASGQVVGRVIDGKTSAPIAGVAVSIDGHQAVTTGADGSYSFTNLAPGTYQVTAKKSGFTEGQKIVTIRAADTERANFALSSTSVRSIRIPTRP